MRAEIKALVLRLSEFGDVQVLVSCVKDENTIDYREGSGNWNTRVQLARAFVQQADDVEHLRTEDAYASDELWDDDDDDEDDKHKHSVP